MGRNTADFHGGFEGFTHAYHVSPRANRESIEANGFDPEKSQTHSFGDEEYLPGVFGHVHKEDVDPTYASGWQAGSLSNAGGDVYRYQLPNKGNQWDENSILDSVRTSSHVPPHHIQRIGHATSEGELHWHKEEDCND